MWNALSFWARSWLVAMIIGTVACAIFAGLTLKARSQEGLQVTVYCGDAREVAANLKEKLGQVLAGQGQISADGVIAVYARPDGTFTVLRVSATGVACVVARGIGWESLVPVPRSDLRSSPLRGGHGGGRCDGR